MPTQLENRNVVRVERGGRAPRVYGAKRSAERQEHDLVIAATDDVSLEQHADWAYDLRRGRLRIYGGLLRFIDRLHRLGFSKETALMIPSWIAEYIENVWDDKPAERTAATERAA